jgi:tRNA G37 N-methylase TrmD
MYGLMNVKDSHSFVIAYPIFFSGSHSQIHTYRPIKVLMFTSTVRIDAKDNHNINKCKVTLQMEFTPVRYVPHA